MSKISAQVDSVTVEKVSIINANHKVEGIYRTFDEFRRNEPFYSGPFTVIPARVTIDAEPKAFTVYGTNDYVDQLGYDGKIEAVRHQWGKSFFGYCKNDTVYISFWRFHPILEFGHLSLIRVVELKLVLIGSSFHETYVDKWFVLDYMNGDLYSINTFSLKEKLRLWDKELFKEYKKSKNKRDLEVQLEFVRKFNQRNPIRF